jgi:hypothetical protein
MMTHVQLLLQHAMLARNNFLNDGQHMQARCNAYLCLWVLAGPTGTCWRGSHTP